MLASNVDPLSVMKILLVVLVASVVAYFILHVLRSFHIAAEWRGLWAGAAAFAAGDFAARVTVRWRKRR